MSNNIEGKVVVITGASRGLGEATARHLSAQEADALLLAVHWSRIDDVLSQTGDLSGKVIVSCLLASPR